MHSTHTSKQCKAPKRRFLDTCNLRLTTTTNPIVTYIPFPTTVTTTTTTTIAITATTTTTAIMATTTPMTVAITSTGTDPYIRWVDLGSIFHEMGPESAKMTFETTPGRKISFRIDLDHSRGPKHP